jgi:hypothetical protein
MSKTHKLGVPLVLLCSCSLAMTGVDPAWDGKREPVCTDSYVPAVIDGMTASVIASSVVQLASDDTVALDERFVAGGIVLALLYTTSAAIGVSRYKACRVARADWQTRDAIRDARLAANGADAGAIVPPAPGYYCTRSATRANLTLCVRRRAACAHAREVLAILDGEDCAPQSVAWCFDVVGTPRCFARPDSCEAMLAKAPDATSDCTERS